MHIAFPYEEFISPRTMVLSNTMYEYRVLPPGRPPTMILLTRIGLVVSLSVVYTALYSN